MGQYTSYYLYQKYEKIGNQDWLPAYPNIYSVDGDGTMPYSSKTEDDPACGYIPPELYRWVNLDPTTDYYCEYCGDKVTGTYGESGETFMTSCNTSTTLVATDIPPVTGLTFAKVGECVTEIGNNVFVSRDVLSGVSIPSTVTSIGTSAFTNCQGLLDCILPDSVTSIGSGAFHNCISLTNFVLWDTVTTIGDSAFRNCDSLISINIPTGLTSIPNYCFESCGALSEVTIPTGVTSIGTSAFTGCRGLIGITLKATTPPSLGSYAIEDTNNCPIYVPASAVNTYKTDSDWSGYSSRIQAITT